MKATLDPQATAASETGVYDRNRRYEVPAGTLWAQGMVRHPYTERTEQRLRYQAEATRLAAQEFERVHGPIEWDRVSVLATHVTCQTLVELRVDP